MASNQANRIRSGRFRSHKLLLLLVVALVGAVPTRSLADETEAVKQRLLKEGTAKWEEYRAFSIRLQGTVKQHITDTKQGEAPRDVSKNEYTYKQNEKATLKIMHQTTARGTVIQASGFNSKYSFSVRRGSENEKWVVSDLNVDPKRDGTTSKALIDEVFLGVAKHFFVENKYFVAEFFKKQNVAITTGSYIKRGQVELVQITFTYSPLDKEALRGGRIVFDPSLYWHIVECETLHQLPDGSIQANYVNEVSADAKKRPILTKQTGRAVPKGNAVTPRVRADAITFDLREDSDVPEKEMTLTAFGLPEPEGISWENKSRLYLWIIAASAACLILGLACRWWVKSKH